MNEAPDSTDALAGDLPPAAARHLRRAGRALRRADFAATQSALLACMASAPGHPAPQRMLARMYMRLGRADDAIGVLRSAAQAHPADVAIGIELAEALADEGEAEAAIECLRRLSRSDGDIVALSALARMLGRQGYVDESMAVAERVLELEPARARTRLHYALDLFHVGRTEQASSQFRSLIHAGEELPGAWFGLAEMKSCAFDAADLVQLRRLVDVEAAPGRPRAMLLHALGKACEDNGEFAGALRAFAESAAIGRAAMPWRRQLLEEQLAKLQAAPIAALAQAPDTFGSEVVFILGIPRSGSTLLHQMLATHPMVEGAGELLALPQILKQESRARGVRFPLWVGQAVAADWRRMGASYLARTHRWRATRPRFIDKYPANWLVAELALAMLPGARIIECRRDPLELSWSCFKQCFAPGSAPWSQDFGDIAHYLKLCCAHMDRLARAYPQNVRIQSYERLLAEPQAQLRELSDFCNLPFDPTCLRFYASRAAVLTPSAAQVRMPLHTPPAAGERYGKLLDPLREALRNA